MLKPKVGTRMLQRPLHVPASPHACLHPCLRLDQLRAHNIKAIKSACNQFLVLFPTQGLDAECFLRNVFFLASLGPTPWLVVPLPADPAVLTALLVLLSSCTDLSIC